MGIESQFRFMMIRHAMLQWFNFPSGLGLDWPCGPCGQNFISPTISSSTLIYGHFSLICILLNLLQKALNRFFSAISMAQWQFDHKSTSCQQPRPFVVFPVVTACRMFYHVNVTRKHEKYQRLLCDSSKKLCQIRN